jgi:hypothetical protein
MWQHMSSMPVMRIAWRRELDDGLIIIFKFLNILIIFIISNIDKEINLKIP